jgi:sugar transferase (PEP-CTERM system associated)
MINIFGRFVILKHLLFFLTENLFILGVVLLGVSVRFSFDADLIGSYENLFWRAFLISVVCQLCLYYNDLYVMEVEVRGRVLLLRLVQSLGVAWVILSVIYYIYPSVAIGRGIFLITIVLLFLLFLILRLLYLKALDLGTFNERVLIVGSGRLAKDVGEKLLARRDLGYQVVGFIDDDPAKLGQSIVNPQVIGDYQSIPRLIKQERVSQVVVALPDRRGKLPINELLDCKLQGTRVVDGVSFYEQITGKIIVEELKPSWLIFSEGFRKPRHLQIMKRLLDILLSATGLLVASPLLLLAALLIRLDSPGKVFYRQERVGENGRLFPLLKFRSMGEDAETDTGPVWAERQDPRVTRVGKVLRKTRLDELPQMINVLRGEMSFVGPRPERLHFVEDLKEKIPYYSLRHTVQPGITGWAQIKYQYGSSVKDAMEKLQYDLFYIKNMSLFFDLTVLFQTIKIVMFGGGAR